MANTEKPLKISKTRVNGLPFAYDYARSISEPIHKANVKHIVCDMPSHAINAHVISDLSRVTDHIHIVTDDKAKALRFFKATEQKVNATDLPVISSIDASAQNSQPLDAKLVEKQLCQYAAIVTEKMLGPPNPALSDAECWRYGVNGNLTVQVQGKQRGEFYNHETGEWGGMVQLLKGELGLSFREAVACGAGMAKEIQNKGISAHCIEFNKVDVQQSDRLNRISTSANEAFVRELD